MLDPRQLTGRARDHVVELEAPRCTLHRDAVAPFLALRGAALADGIDLVAVSSFRDFERQRAIWNAKFRGERPLLDRAGRALEALALPPAQRVETILWWSALPGASRHHWGSDCDVIDRAALPPGVEPRLVPEEFAADGPFARLEAWLEANLARFGFFRPYVVDRGGVSPEPWHLSYAPVAVPAAAALTVEVLREALSAEGVSAAGVEDAGSAATAPAGVTAQAGAPLEGFDAVVAALPAIHARFVAGTDAPRPGPAWVEAALAAATLSPRSRPS